MSLRSSMALNVAPLALRLTLGLTFVWAGIGKVAHSAEVTDPAEIAILAEWGQIDPLPGGLPAPDDNPDNNPDTNPDFDPDVDPESDNNPELDNDAPETDEGVEPEPNDPTEGVPEQTEETDEPDATDTETQDMSGEETSAEEVLPVAYAQADRPVTVKRVLKLALLIHHAANPGVGDDGQPKMPLWPEPLAKNNLPVVLAWIAAITELVCGAAILTGFFTRLAALPIIGTMIGAMWLTQIGPALQAGETTFGFLPAGIYEMNAGGYVWTHLFWQFALAMMGLALFFLGAGALSIDRLIFGSVRDDRDYEARQVEFVPMSEA